MNVVNIERSKSGDAEPSCSCRNQAGSILDGAVRKWVRPAEIDAGQRAGRTLEESAALKRLKREVAELRRANEILKAPTAFIPSRLVIFREPPVSHRPGNVDGPSPLPAFRLGSRWAGPARHRNGP